MMEAWNDSTLRAMIRINLPQVGREKSVLLARHPALR
ncbi:hypothetical protein U713_15410 [Rhodobacter capsulatus YW2]|nr:hypothetical protein U703_06085 [Rhodobacter capsulatus YW1]ETD87889.1 hypothetical protein U713_15410 [Rhodobacter capsulatus YW2]